MDDKDKIIAEKDRRIAALEAENAALKEEIRVLMQRIEDLERRLSMNSSNSSKPPSMDGFKKPSRHSLREKGKRPSGGQKGHKGHTLVQVETPDHVIEHTVENCQKCGQSIHDVSAESVCKRQVFDIPKPRIEVTEHRIQSKICPCGHKNRAAFPENATAPVQYGKRIKAMSVYLLNQQLIPEDRVQQVFQDLFQLNISTETLMTTNEKFADAVKPRQEETLKTIKSAPVKHLDETGFRVGGLLHWLHVISTTAMTHYRVSRKRGNLLDGVLGIAVHDHWKPYFKMETVEHALCNAHHLRELKALEASEPWAMRMSKLLTRTLSIVSPDLDRVKSMYDTIIAEGLRFHKTQRPPTLGKRRKRAGHNLLIRLQKFKDNVLKFLDNPNVPFTNNQAEQDVRMMKVKQKISGCFRTLKGAENFAIIRGFISTNRKQSINVFDAIASLYP